MNMIKANGLCLHYADTGEAELPVLVFANSLGTDFRLWDGVVQKLAGRFRMVRYDKRGHGLSEAPPAPYKISDHIGDVAALLDALEITEVIFIGVSVGGQIAQGLAASRPDLVKALVLCDTAAKIGTADAWAQRIAAIEAGGIGSISEAILERWFAPHYREGEPVAMAGWRAMLTRTTQDGYVGTCAAIRDADLTASTKALDLPVLCLCGAVDGSTPPELVKATADLIKGATFLTIDDAGHLPFIEGESAVLQAITNFIEEKQLA